MNEYAYCPKCSRKYNVSRLRDRTKIFICMDCVGKDGAKMNGGKYIPVYNRAGFATVRA